MSRRRYRTPPEFAAVVLGGLVLAVLVGVFAVLCGGIGAEVAP